MRVDCALLCDAATVREGLLHILGGGITRLARPSFPAPLGVALAMRILIHPTEAGQPHQMQIQLQGADGQRIAAIDAQFGVNDPSMLRPGEEASVALPVILPPQVGLPTEGRYSFEILIDGIHQATVPFTAEVLQIPQLGGPPR